MDIKTLRELDEQLRNAIKALKVVEATVAKSSDVRLQCLVNVKSMDLENTRDSLWAIADQQLEKSTIVEVHEADCFCVHCLG